MSFIVPSTVRVRREDFGLLFYDTRSTRLTFVRSREALIPLPADGGGARELAIADRETRQDEALVRVLETLQTKGLIVAAGPAE